MATSLHRVYQNFVWRIEAITPTSVAGYPRGAFVEVDPLRFKPEQAAGSTRCFSIAWQGGSAATDVSDGATLRTHWQRYQLTVYYSAALKWSTVHELVAVDRNDLIKQLWHENMLGYDASNTTTNIGLEARVLDSDVFSSGLDVHRYVQTWRCFVIEVP